MCECGAGACEGSGSKVLHVRCGQTYSGDVTELLRESSGREVRVGKKSESAP